MEAITRVFERRGIEGHQPQESKDLFPRLLVVGDEDPGSCRDRCHAWYLMSTRVRPFGRCSRDPPLYRPQLGNLNHLCHRTALDFVPRFVHSLFALEFPPSKLQRPYLTSKRNFRKESYILNYLTSLPQSIYIIYRNGCFNFQKEMSKTACLEFLANRPL